MCANPVNNNMKNYITPALVALVTVSAAYASVVYGGTLLPVNQINLCETNASTSTAITLDWQNTCPQVLYQVGTAAFTVTFVNATTSAMNGSRKLVWICNPATASAGAITWTGTEWVGTAPTQTTTQGQCDVYSFDVTRATSTSVYKVAGSAGAGFQ
jgi:hypothetical protein